MCDEERLADANAIYSATVKRIRQLPVVKAMSA
jgi:CO/xanthine dehydrogenase Mo-binding subunit